MHKKIYTFCFICLIALFSGCSKSNSPTSPNGGSNNNLSQPTEVRITAVKILGIPWADVYGVGWDLFTGPDIFWKLRAGSTLYLTSQVIYDISSANLPITWSGNAFLLSNWGQTYTLDVYDFDDVSDSDLIGSVSFSVNGIKSGNGFTSLYTTTGSPGTLQISLQLEWK